MGSIRRHKNAMTALLAEYRENPLPSTEYGEDFEDFSQNKKRRGDEGSTGSGMCQSIVRYARPQKARSASGEWKYIVNTGQHTQTLRLEKCTNPQESCSYLANNYRSHCTQVYNYHRLLSWDKTRGLHVDIFKVPTCCTCQVDGYRQQFPPLAAVNNKDFTPSQLEPYTTINEELDYNDEEDEDDFSYHFGKGFSQLKGREPNDFDINELQSSSKTIRSKVYPPRPTVGSYLSPPENEEYESQYGFQSAVGAVGGKTSKTLLGQLPTTRRRPYKSLSSVDDNAANEARVDLEISPSEIHQEKEVRLFGSRPPKQRKTIYSVPHTASATSGNENFPSSSRTGSSNSNSSFQKLGRGHTTTFRPHTGKTTGGRTPIQQQQQPQASSSAASHAFGGSSRFSSKPQSPGYIQETAEKTSSSPSNIHASTPATASTVSMASTKSTYGSSSPTATSIYNVNAIYSAKLNTSTGSKRVNYSYHPIIDFFEVNKRTQVSTTTPYSVGKQQTSLPPVPYVHTIPKVGGQPYQTHHERRIGFGAVGGEEYSGDTNSWKPIVLTT